MCGSGPSYGCFTATSLKEEGLDKLIGENRLVIDAYFQPK